MVIVDWNRSLESRCLVPVAVALGVLTGTRPRLSNKHCRRPSVALQVGDPEPQAAAEAYERFAELKGKREEQELQAPPEAEGFALWNGGYSL